MADTENPVTPLPRGRFLIVPADWASHATVEEALSLATREHQAHPGKNLLIVQVVASLEATITSTVTRHRF
jgi:hypothetical protein